MKTSLRIILRALDRFNTHNAYQMGAALAYYMLFSLAPLLLLAIAIAGAVFGEDAAQDEVYEQLDEAAGRDTARLVQDLIVNADQMQAKSWAPYVGVALSLFAAVQAFLHLRQSFCLIWEIQPPGHNTYLGLLLNYGLSVLMVFSGGLLLVMSLAASTALAVIERHWPLPIPGGWQTVEIAVSFIFLVLMFGLLYWILSGRLFPLGYVLYGAIICAVLFLLGKSLLGWYLAYTSTTSVYGAAGSLVGFLMWVYYSSLIIFLGAELIQARRTRAEWMR